MTEFALQAVELVRRIEGAVSHTLVNGIDLAVNKGEFVAITGPSGSGKSSLLYLLGLLDAPSEGEVIICGQPTSKLSGIGPGRCPPDQMRLRVPVPFPAAGVHLARQCAAADAPRASDRRSEMRERGLALLGLLGLASTPTSVPTQLSGGQRQRVAIARALANRPEIIVADEPTGALDTASTEQVFSILRDIADQGQTVVVVTHDPALAARADRRIHIVDGKIAEITERGGGELVCEAGS